MTVKLSAIAIQILFDYDDLSTFDLEALITQIPPKQSRMLARIHPDNKLRSMLLVSTGVEIGEGSVVNSGVTISDNYKKLLFLGNRVSVGPNVTFLCASSPNNSSYLLETNFVNHYVVEKSIIIENDVWIGANAVLLPGVVLGTGTIVGAGSVVTKSTNPQQVVAGNPARLLNIIE